MSKQTDFDKLSLLGVDVDAISIADAITYIIDHSTTGHRAGYVIKPYVEFLDAGYHDNKLQELLNAAELSVADGVALTWAAHFLYAGRRSAGRFWLTLSQIVLAPSKLNWPLPDRAAGINFTWPLLAAAAAAGRRLYLIGDPKTGSIGHTARTLQRAFPSLIIAGTHSGRDRTQAPGQVGEAWLAELADAVAAADPDVILTGMGFPLQERVNAYLATHLSHGLAVGEGGTFDYETFGGDLHKAPLWSQRLGLEWFWRLLQEPTRIKRQLAIPRFMYRIWRNH